MMTGINKYGATDIGYPYDVQSLKHLTCTMSKKRQIEEGEEGEKNEKKHTQMMSYLPGSLHVHLQPKCQCVCLFWILWLLPPPPPHFFFPSPFFHFFNYFFTSFLIVTVYLHRLWQHLGFLECFVVTFFFFRPLLFLFCLQVFLLSLFISTDCGNTIKPNTVMPQNGRQEQ